MSETPKDNIPESSTKIPSAIGEDETTEAVIKSFVLEAKPSRQLKLAIDSLSNPLFNNSGMGRIDVNEDGLEITVKDDQNCIGHVLLLAKADVINFRFYKPLEGLLVPIDDIFLKFTAEDDDPFTISYDHDGSYELCFAFGNGDPLKLLKVKLSDNTKAVPKFPSPISFCEANVPSDVLTSLLPHLSKDDIPQLVYVYITDKAFIIEAGGTRVYHHVFPPTERGRQGMMGAGQRHYAEFYWPYAEILKTASELLGPASFILCFLNEPAKSIMFKFPLSDLGGHLEFIKNAHKTLSNHEAMVEFLALTAMKGVASSSQEVLV